MYRKWTIFHITYKKEEERKEQLHYSAQATAAPSGRFFQISLPPFKHKSYSFTRNTNFRFRLNPVDMLKSYVIWVGRISIFVSYCMA